VFLDNIYKDKYFTLIEEALLLNRDKQETYFENHHIIPRSLGGDNTHSNLVLLTPEEHYLSHFYLTQIVSGKNYYKMINAWLLMNSTINKSGDIIIDSKIYAKLKKDFSNHLKVVNSGSNNPNSKEVYQISKSGKIIKKWEYIKLANVKYPGCDIAACCRGKQKTSAGYLWCFVEDYQTFIKTFKDSLIDRRIGRNSPVSKKIYQIDKNTKKIIKLWGTLTEASRNTNTNINSIIACAQGKYKTANNFIWAYENCNLKKITILNVSRKGKFCCHSKQVYRLDDDNNILEEFNSVAEAKKIYGGDIYACVQGRTQKAAGYKWKFKN